jgi:hypothetical protein
MTATDQNMILAVPVAWGWLLRVMRTSQAILKLVELGFDVETTPLRRSVLEHSVRLHWAATNDPDMWMELLYKEHGSTFTKFRVASASGVKLSSEQLKWIKAQEAKSSDRFDEKSNLSHMAHIFQSAPEIYGSQRQAWLLDSRESHPTLTSASPYSREISETQIELMREPADSLLRDALPDVCVHLYVALDSFARIAGTIDEISEGLGEVTKKMQAVNRAK